MVTRKRATPAKTTRARTKTATPVVSKSVTRRVSAQSRVVKPSTTPKTTAKKDVKPPADTKTSTAAFDPQAGRKLRDGKPGDPFWHVHHEVLAEILTEAESSRLNAISNKPFQGQAIRRKWMSPILGALPKAIQDKIAELGKTAKTYRDLKVKADEAYQAYNKARATAISRWNYTPKRHSPEYKALLAEKKRLEKEFNAAYLKLERQMDADIKKINAPSIAAEKKWRAADTALRKVTSNHAAEQAINDLMRNNKQVLALHKKEHPGCPWDGRSLFRNGGY